MPDRITINFICPPSVYNIVRKDGQVHLLNSFANLHQARTPRIYPLYLHQYCCCQLYIIAQSDFLFSIEVYQDHNNKPYCKPCETKPKISFLFSPFCSIWAWFTTIRVCLKQIIAVRIIRYFLILKNHPAHHKPALERRTGQQQHQDRQRALIPVFTDAVTGPPAKAERNK